MPHSPTNAAIEDQTGHTLTIVRRHAHEVRNYVHSMDLELILLGELASDTAARESVARIRAQLSAIEVSVKSLVVKFAEPEPIVAAAADLLQLWKLQITSLQSQAREVEWITTQESRSVRMDVRAVVAGLTELTLAAWNRSTGESLRATLRVENELAVIELREPNQTTPMPADLMSELERLVTVNGGCLEHEQGTGDTFVWITSLKFPVLTNS